MDDDVGRRIGRFRIARRIGEGGMGIVFEAQTDDGEVVALKKLREKDAGNMKRRKQRFAREAKLTEAIDHPGVVRVREVIEDAGDLFLVMELVAGESLRAKLDGLRARNERMKVAEALAIARSVADAVAHAHRKGVVHRDLKPENVMLTNDVARVLDFGLAKMQETEGGVVYDAETESNVTEEGHVLGTPAYMSPEQARGQEVGFRADVFSLGVVLYEMLTGSRPFSGGSTIDVIAAITRDAPPPPSQIASDVPSAVDDLVLACLAKKADARPTMDAFAESLAALVQTPSKRMVSRATTKLFARVGGAVTIVLVAAFGVRAFLHQRAANAAAANTPVTSLPIPASDVPEAIAAYRAALQDERDGAEDAAMLELDRATTLDPTLAAAHLRLAVREAFIEAQNARTHFSAAVAHRDKLSERDAAMLDAMRPVFQRTEPDVTAWASGMRTLAQRFSGDAEIALEVAKAEDALGDFHGSEIAAAHAAQIDPHFALALATQAQARAYLGDFAGARETIKQCLSLSRTASWCIWVVEFIDGSSGQCAANEASARARVAVDPTIPEGYKALAYALVALDQPESAAREASNQAVLREPEGFPRQRLDLNMNLRFAIVHGRFDEAESIMGTLDTLLKSRADSGDHAMPSWLEAELARELGHNDRAAAIAKDFLDRKDVWLKNPIANDYAIANDLTPLLLALQKHTGAMSSDAYESAIKIWRGQWEAALHGSWRPYLWVYGYADVVETREEAEAALRALEQLGPIPPFLIDGDMPEAGVGRTFFLAGRTNEAITHLRRAAHSCDTLTHPITWVQSHVWLADALAQSGDKTGACQEYAFAIGRWKNATHSTTVNAARERSHALGCE